MDDTALKSLTADTLRVIEEAVDIAHHVVWAVMTTVDGLGRPRSRIVHPVWVLHGGRLTGWLTTRRTPLKARHLATNPHVSLAYVGANTDFAYFDCMAEWAEDPDARRECWDAFLEAPPPVHYDPATIWPNGPDSESFAALRFTPYRVQAGRAERIAQGEKPGLVRF